MLIIECLVLLVVFLVSGILLIKLKGKDMNTNELLSNYYKEEDKIIAKQEKNVKNIKKETQEKTNGFKTFFVRAFDFRGICTRKEFWAPFLVYAVLAIIIIMIITFSFYESCYGYYCPRRDFTWVYLISFLVGIPFLSAQVRRLHDAGFSGVLIYLFAGIQAIVEFGNLSRDAVEVSTYVILGIGVLVFIGCLYPSVHNDSNKHWLYEKKSNNTQKNISSSNKFISMDDLEKAAKLYKQKLITKEEFEDIKKQCFGK